MPLLPNGVHFSEERGILPLSRQSGHGVRPGLDGGPDGVVLVGRDPDARAGEGDVVVITRRVVALELTVVGLAGEVPLGHPAHRGREGRVSHRLRGVCIEGGDRGGLERDVSDALAGLLVDEVHLRGIVLAVPDDRVDKDAVGVGVVDAPEGVVVDDGLNEVVERRCTGDRGRKVPDRRLVHGLLHEVCHGLFSMPARLPGNMTDKHRICFPVILA